MLTCLKKAIMLPYLQHKTIYESENLVDVRLPFIDELRAFHVNGDFPLTVDPIRTDRCVIVGMFVVRPALSEPFTETLLNEEGLPTSLFSEKFDWSYNLQIDKFQGGWLVANGSALDVYRLGMQYGLSDAVMVSSNNVSTEGVDTSSRKGFVWQSYNPFQWPHVSKLDSDLEAKVQKQRAKWIEMGYLSSRRYPAQIVFTYSGLQFENAPDFLQGRIFHDYLPTGERMETYIITSELGAIRIRERAHLHDLQDRIEEMLITLPPPSHSTTARPNCEIDLSPIPTLLYKRYNIKLVNHDGGQKVLNDFMKAGILSQLHLTLGRQRNLQQIVETHMMNSADKSILSQLDYTSKFQYFFNDETKIPTLLSIPKTFPILSLIEDCDHDEVAIAIFDTSRGCELNRM